jgi:hypothetical protein
VAAQVAGAALEGTPGMWSLRAHRHAMMPRVHAVARARAFTSTPAPQHVPEVKGCTAGAGCATVCCARVAGGQRGVLQVALCQGPEDHHGTQRACCVWRTAASWKCRQQPQHVSTSARQHVSTSARQHVVQQDMWSHPVPVAALATHSQTRICRRRTRCTPGRSSSTG